MSLSALAWSNHRHQLRHPAAQLTVIVISLLATSLLTVALVSSAVQRHLDDDLKTMLGADQILTQSFPLSATEAASLNRYASLTSSIVITTINISHAGQWRRAELKMVDDNYPLQGHLRVSETPGGEGITTQRGPAPGEVWVDHRLLSALSLTIGGTLNIAGSSLSVTAVVNHEPDRLSEGHSDRLRLMVHRESLNPAMMTGNGQRYRYLIAADTDQRSEIKRWSTATLPAAQLIDRHDGDHPLSAHWQRIENFFGLSAVVLFMLAAVALDMVMRQKVSKDQSRYALYSMLGINRAQTLRLLLMEWSWLMITVGLPSLAAAGVLQLLAIEMLQNQLPLLSWQWQPAAVLRGGLLTAALFLALQTPFMWDLYRTPGVSLVRDDPRISGPWRYLWYAVAIALLTTYYSDNWLLTGMMLSTLFSATLMILAIAWLTLWLADKAGNVGTGGWPLAVYIMRQRGFSKSAQIVSVGLCVTLVLFSLLLMRDIGNAMFSHARTSNGNLLISEANAADMAYVESWIQRTGSTVKDLRHYASAQLTHINGLTPSEHARHTSATLARIAEPVRLSWSDQLPDNNRLVQGAWWRSRSADWQQVSVEHEVMTDLGLTTGDTLTFYVGNKPVSLKVVAAHVFAPGGSAMTFWFVAPEAIKHQLTSPTRFMASVEVPEKSWSELTTLVTDHPALAIVSLRELTARFDAMLTAVRGVSLAYSILVLALAIAVLCASLIGYAESDQRRHALLKSFGLSRRHCLALAALEWLFTGTVAALGAVGGTWIGGQLIYQSQLQMTYQPDIAWLAGIVVLSGMGICLVGVAASWRSLKTPVHHLLAV